MDEERQPTATGGGSRDGLAAVAITLLTIALIVFLITRIV